MRWRPCAPSAGPSNGVFVGAGYSDRAGAATQDRTAPSPATADRTGRADATVTDSASLQASQASPVATPNLNRQVDSSVAAASATKPKKVREQRTRPLHQLTQEE
eukprot:COSAG02_NODE_35634_length_465_cov_1.412568_1_plen_104_part_01